MHKAHKEVFSRSRSVQYYLFNIPYSTINPFNPSIRGKRLNTDNREQITDNWPLPTDDFSLFAFRSQLQLRLRLRLTTVTSSNEAYREAITPPQKKPFFISKIIPTFV